jgi:hypothetical protein
MTCLEARELLSGLLDDAVTESERRSIEAHLETCAECRRELAALRETVALLHRAPGVRAPAGFVDRVMETAYRPSWPRRVADALFRPLRVKLPLEAAAVVLVSVSALYVYRHAPEVQQVARQETREAAPRTPAGQPAAPPVADNAGPPSPDTTAALRPRNEIAELEAKRDAGPPVSAPPAVAPAAPAANVQRENVAPSTAPDATASTAPVASGEARRTPEATSAAQTDAKKEVRDERRGDAPPAVPPAGTLQKQAQRAASSPSRDAAGARATPAPPAAAAPPPPPEARARARSSGAAQPAPPPLERGAEPFSVGKPRAAAKLMRAADASGRLVVPATEPAEVALDALLNRLGGIRVARRLEGPQGLILVDVIVAAARYAELVEGLGKIGRWTAEHEPKTLPAQVRVEVALSAER